MITKLYNLYINKIEMLLTYVQERFKPLNQLVEEQDILEKNITALDPDSFDGFNNSGNSFLIVRCDEVKMQKYISKIQKISLTIKASKDIYSLLYTGVTNDVSIGNFFLSDSNNYSNEVELLSEFKQTALDYVTAYNLLKESPNTIDELNHLRLTNFTNNLNDTVCSLLILQEPKS